MDIKHHIVVLAGGPGTRLWPESKPEKPKPFLHFPRSSDPTLLSQCLSRAFDVVDEKNVWLVMHEKYQEYIEEPYRSILRNNLLFEPEAKNTTLAILFACLKLRETHGLHTVVTFLPCDHYIEDEKNFSFQLRHGSKLAITEKKMITYGIDPFYPSTSYGYIQVKKSEGESFVAVEKFTEKPTLEKAKSFIEEGNYYWNSGMFTFTLETFFREFAKYVEIPPSIQNLLSQQTFSTMDIHELYNEFPNISIDYALMEKTKDILLIPASFVWSDIGTWNSIKKISNLPNSVDGQGTILMGENNYIRSKKPIILCGLNNVYVIQTDDETLIVSEDHLDKIGELRSYLPKK